MLSHSYYEEDPRVRREAEALVAAGREVDLIALRKPGADVRELIGGVDVRRLPIARQQGAGLWRYLREYLAFFWRAGLQAARLHRRRRYGLVQVHTLPDFLVFAVAPLRALGVPLLIDLHEAMPEFFRSRFGRVSNPLVRGMLGLAERLSIGFATAAITVNDALAERLSRRGVPAEKVTVIVNSARRDRFDPSAHPERSFMADGALRLVYAGAVTPLYQLEVVIEALALLRDGWDGRPPAAFPVCLAAYGRGDAEAALRALVAARGLEERVAFGGRIPIDAVAARIAAADAGVSPTSRDAYTDFSLSTKLFEYTAMGKPALASRLPTVERYFGPDGLFYFEPGDAASLAEAIARLVAVGPAGRAARVDRARAVLDRFSWEREGARYVALVERLASG